VNPPEVTALCLLPQLVLLLIIDLVEAIDLRRIKL